MRTVTFIPGNMSKDLSFESLILTGTTCVTLVKFALPFEEGNRLKLEAVAKPICSTSPDNVVSLYPST